MILALQRLGLMLGPQQLLTVPGRRTGKPRTTPVAVVPVAGARYLLQAFPGAVWVENAREAGAGVLARGRAQQRVRLILLPVGERAEILRRRPAVSGRAAGIFVRSGMTATTDPDAFAAAAPRCAVFRIEAAPER